MEKRLQNQIDALRLEIDALRLRLEQQAKDFLSVLESRLEEQREELQLELDQVEGNKTPKSDCEECQGGGRVYVHEGISASCVCTGGDSLTTYCRDDM